jgi:hypothetical protein
MSGADSENFLAFLQELRADPAGKNLYITLAASNSPFAGPDGTPMTDVSKFADVVDHITFMNYDINVRTSRFTPATCLTVHPVGSMDHGCWPQFSFG